MINAQELRIGNIYNRKHGKGWTPTIITPGIMGKIFGDSNEYALNDFEPITTTPEFLELLGFEKDGFNAYNYSISPWPESQLKHLSFAGDYLYLREGFMNKPRHEDELVVLWNNDLRGIMPVHQLQNLVYALTGQELIIKEIA